jgi:pimeloyl-ACP methyl ester carboxylesterase
VTERPLVEGSVTLSDGRKLAYAEWGEAAGAPVMLFHGTPGSRLLCPGQEETAAGGVRLIVPDRPGYGASDRQAGRHLTEWPGDVAALADHLGLERFAVLGWSGGGPHALACAHAVPERLEAVGVIASPGPTEDVPGAMDDPQRRPVHDGALTDRVGTADFIVSFFEDVDSNDGERWFEVLRANFPEPLRDVRWEANMREHVVEGFRPGGAGRADDAVANFGPWGFRPEDVGAHVLLFHGGRDETMPRAHFDHLCSTLPSCTPVLFEDEEHALIYPRWPEILRTILT